MNGAHDPGDLRRRLIAGSFLAADRAALPPGVRLRSDEELQASLAQTLAARPGGEDVHVFGCGSLMWNPAMDARLLGVATAHGWRRRFCLRAFVGRGSVDKPGVMVALDRGGACQGVLLRIEAAKVPEELRLLWRREMLVGSYQARWIRARIDGRRVSALAFVVDRRNERYIARMDAVEAARLILTGEGRGGTTREYFRAMRESMARLGIRDAGMDRLARAVDAAALSAA